MKKMILVGLGLAVTLGACAQSPDRISASYVSPTMYSNFTCQQLAEEAQRVSNEVGIATGAQKDKATRDAVAVGVATVIFWPALFFVGGDQGNAANLSNLKGQMQAIEQANIQKRCGIRFQQG
jgi:hypothetical protein